MCVRGSIPLECTIYKKYPVSDEEKTVVQLVFHCRRAMTVIIVVPKQLLLVKKMLCFYSNIIRVTAKKNGHNSNYFRCTLNIMLINSNILAK